MRAVGHTLDGGPAEIARTIAERGSDLIASGLAQALIDAAAGLPAEARTADVLLALAEAHAVCGHPEEALQCLHEATGSAPMSAGAAWRAIFVHSLRADLDGARAAIATAGEAAFTGASDRDRALLHAWIAHTHRRVGETERAAEEAQAALRIAEASGDDRSLAAAHNIVGLVAGMRADHAEAETRLRAALAAAERANDVITTIRILSGQGTMEFERSAFAAGIATYEHAAQLAESAGFVPMLAQSRMNLGLLKWSIGRLDEAAREYADAIALYRATGSREVAYALVGKGDVHRERGELALARAAYQEGLAIGEASGDRQALVPALYQMAKVMVDEDPDEALRLAGRAVALGWPDLSWALNALGWIQLACADAGAALASGQRAAEVAREQHDRYGLADALSLQAMASADAGVRRHLLGESLAAWREVGNPIQIALAELALARAESAVRSQAAAETAERRLRRMGFGLSASGAAGLGRSIARGPSDAPVEIRVLGGFQLLRHGEPVAAGSWQSRKARDLLKILVTRRGRPVPRESLAEALWPEDGTDSVASRLSVALSTVRAVLDPGHDHPADQFVTADASSIALRTDRVRVDLEIFFATVDAALAARGADARELLEAAEAAYTGDLLEEDPHAEWAVALRERARAAYIRVAHTLADLALRAGDHQDAVDLFLRILERDGYDEPAHLGLVAALETAGRHGEARRAHAAYGGRMRELGVPTAPFPAPQAARTSP